MPVLGSSARRRVEHGIAACELVTEHGGLGHTSAVYARDDDVVDRFARAVRTGRILVNAPTAVGALGGIYNSMTPTFSLGCGTWGGSITTDNVNYRNLLNVKTVSRRQAPPQWFRVPSDTYFNPGALENLRQLGATQALIVTDADTARRAAWPTRCAATSAAPACTCSPTSSPSPRGADPRRRRGARRASTRTSIVAVGGGSVLDAAKAMRLFHESPELDAARARRCRSSTPASASRTIPQIEHTRAARRDADHGGHRFGGLTGGRDHRRRPQGHAGRLLARARHGDRRSAD